MTGFVPLEVKFRDISSGDPTSWTWLFGDGGTSNAQNPTHSYLIPGIFSVDLTVTREGVLSNINKTNFITVTENRPVANFKTSTTAGQVPLEVDFTDLSQPVGDISTWIWDFGDGKTDSTQNTKHTYNTEGFFTASLTVSNGSGSDIERKTNLIVVINEDVPVAQFKVSTTTGLAPLEITYTDQSEPSNAIGSHVWTFGDGGISTEENPVHIYNNEGIYTVGLTVSNSFGADSEVKPNIISVIGKPDDVIAAFTVNQPIGIVPSNIEFTNNSGGTVVESKWDFGDGSEIVEPGNENISHIYREPREYEISLTVTGTISNDDTEKKSSLIKIIGEGEVAAGFNASPVLGSVPLKVQFIDKSVGEVSSWEWDFGDGSAKSDVANPKNTYFLKGKYDVTLTVNSAGGKSNSIIMKDFIEVFDNDDSDDDSDDDGDDDNNNDGGEDDGNDDGDDGNNDDDGNEKSFIFKCRQQSLIAGEHGIFEKMIMELDENEQCTVTLTNLEAGTTVEFSTYLRSGRSTSVKVQPESGVTDLNGELEFTISAIEEGTDWITWAVKNDKGEFEFSKQAYDNGTAWGMFIEVK